MKDNSLLFLAISLFVLFLFNDCSARRNKNKKDHAAKIVPEKKQAIEDGYDIFLVAGQSNTHAGVPFDPVLDAPDPDIFQLGRFDALNYKVILAQENLQHWTRVEGNIGFALPFAKLYKQNTMAAGRKILIVPCGYGATKIAQWERGEMLYNDIINRVKFCMNIPGSKLKAILWHQGENDLGKGNTIYQAQLDTLITNMRQDLGNPLVPFIVGGLVPYVVNKKGYGHRLLIQDILRHSPDRLPKVGYADPDLPFKIEKPHNDVNESHFDAAGMREMGRRYFKAFTGLQ